MLEQIAFAVGGRVLPHERCSLKASAEEAVREASFTVPYSGAGIPCRPDEEATVTVSGELWGTGYVRDVGGSHDEKDRIYQVSFVSRTCDATECSIDHPTGLKRDADLTGIAQEFDTLGVGVESSIAAGEKKPVHKVRPGETLFETIETDARSRGVLIHDTPEGKLKLADKPEGRHAGALIKGVNILQASGQLTGATRHSPVKVRGQASEGVTGTALHPEAEATDPGVARKRPLIVVQEGEATSERLKKRAAWEAKRGAGRGTTASVTTPGWRDAGGKLWTRNFLVSVQDDWLGINQDMVIADVTLEQDAKGGTTANISLKDPRALGGEDPRGSSDASWGAPAVPTPTFREG